MVGSLKDSWSKFYRAEEHLQTLKAEIPAYVERKPYRIDQEDDLELGWRAFRFYLLEPIPPRWSDILGDFSNNSRSALNFLANELVVLNGRTPTGSTEFPIFADPANFSALDKKGQPARGSGLAKLEGASAAAIKAIEEIQPYNQRRKDPEQHPLWILHEVSNTDKHRNPLVIATGFLEGSWGIGTPGTNAYIEKATLSWSGTERISPLENGAKIARYQFAGKVHGQLGMQFHFAFHIAFPDGPPGFGGDIVESLGIILAWVKNVLTFFDGWFTA
jgi:hypothetical protein